MKMIKLFIWGFRSLRFNLKKTITGQCHKYNEYEMLPMNLLIGNDINLENKDAVLPARSINKVASVGITAFMPGKRVFSS